MRVISWGHPPGLHVPPAMWQPIAVAARELGKVAGEFAESIGSAVRVLSQVSSKLARSPASLLAAATCSDDVRWFARTIGTSEHHGEIDHPNPPTIAEYETAARRFGFGGGDLGAWLFDDESEDW